MSKIEANTNPIASQKLQAFLTYIGELKAEQDFENLAPPTIVEPTPNQSMKNPPYFLIHITVNQTRTLKELVAPTLDNQPLCIEHAP